MKHRAATTIDPDARIPGARIVEARTIVATEYAAPWTLRRLARRVRLPQFMLEEAYVMAYGIKPMEDLLEVRVRKAAQLFARGQRMQDVLMQVGYPNEARFTAGYKRILHADPRRLELLAHAR